MNSKEFIMALDAGTSSSRAIVFDRERHIVAVAQREFRQIYPQPGWVEHDPVEIWDTQLAVAREAMAKAGATASSDRGVGPRNRPSRVQRHRVAVPPHERLLRRA